ncbi:MAG TPA: glutamine amidotransferase [Terracidiphilus sp.]|nr:glutamine amidotransferase [Terracidiphilus sp.]
MGQSWIVLQHAAWEGPGLIAVEAKARGLCLDVRRLDQGASIPDSDQVNGLVVMGGPVGAYETDKYPFLTEECRLLGELAHRNRPVLGICLGSQLLAKALGADVFPGHGPEIGFGFVELTQAGKQDPLFATVGSSIPVFHWHGDTFDLPEGAVLLASNKEYAQQAFRFGSCAYGLQFHIEPDSSTWLDWQEHLPIERSDNTGPQKERIEQLGRRMIARFFDAVL